MNTLKQLIEEQNREFETVFKCINSDCDQNGNIPVPDGEGDWSAEQCQYCFEIRFPALEKFKQSQIALIKAVVEKIDVLNKIDRLGMWSDGLEILKQDLLQELKEIE